MPNFNSRKLIMHSPLEAGLPRCEKPRNQACRRTRQSSDDRSLDPNSGEFGDKQGNIPPWKPRRFRLPSKICAAQQENRGASFDPCKARRAVRRASSEANSHSPTIRIRHRLHLFFARARMTHLPSEPRPSGSGMCQTLPDGRGSVTRRHSRPRGE